MKPLRFRDSRYEPERIRLLKASASRLQAPVRRKFEDFTPDSRRETQRCARGPRQSPGAALTCLHTHERHQRSSFPPLRVRIDPVRLRSRPAGRDGERPVRALRARNPFPADPLGLDDEGSPVEAQARAGRSRVCAGAAAARDQAGSRAELAVFGSRPEVESFEKTRRDERRVVARDAAPAPLSEPFSQLLVR